MQTIIFNHPETTQPGGQIIDPSHLHWIDLERKADLSSTDLPAFVSSILHEHHLKDLSNSLHPPDYECTDNYEVLIFRGIDKRFEIIEPRTRSTVFLLVENTIITIHDEDDKTLSKLQMKWLASRSKHPKDLLSLLHSLLDEIGDDYLNLREPLNSLIQEWQQKLLDPNDPFSDWQVLVKAKSGLRWLYINLDLQRDILQKWRDETHYEFTQSHLIHFNDLDNHLGRIERLSEGIRTDIDSLTDTYFASTGQKTNTIVQFLAVISAIFLPLNLIAGMFGMNFEHLPFLRAPWGPALVILLMILLSTVLLLWFKKHRWF